MWRFPVIDKFFQQSYSRGRCYRSAEIAQHLWIQKQTKIHVNQKEIYILTQQNILRAVKVFWVRSKNAGGHFFSKRWWGKLIDNIYIVILSILPPSVKHSKNGLELKCTANFKFDEITQLCQAHVNSPVCVLLCLCSSSERVKRFPQKDQEQTKGLSPVCQRKCARRWDVFP